MPPGRHSGGVLHGGSNKVGGLVAVLGTEGAACSLGTSHVVTVSPRLAASREQSRERFWARAPAGRQSRPPSASWLLPTYLR